MAAKRISKMAAAAGECLQKAVLEEFRKKALLGQYVIVSQKGKTCRIPAKQALKMAKAKS